MAFVSGRVRSSPEPAWSSGMDTKTPPITSRPQEKHQHLRQQRQQEEVSLPLLPAFPGQRQRTKFSSVPNWRNNVSTPGVLKHQETQRRRPYKVLGIGATPLMHACQQADRPRVLKLLREQEETIGYRDRALRSALHYCMDARTGGAVAQAAPELVDAPDAEGHTALHLAVIAGDAQLVAVLLANGADVNAKDLEGHSVLHWATVCGEVECVRLVLAAGARASSVDLRGGSPLHYAAQCCGTAATAELAVPKKLGLKVLQTLLEFGADVNARDEDGRQPILWAASAGSVEAILALVRAGGSSVANASDKDGLTALHCAASRGHARCIETLVNLCDAQPDQVDDNGCSALHYAATLGHADATSLLLKLGADPNRQDRKGRTPALCAAAKGQLESLKILTQHGASLHARTVRGTGVAHEAVTSGRLELLKWLTRRRPSLLDATTQDGKTPLHVATLHGHLDACKVLLDGGARVNALMRTNKGTLMTALDAALYRGHRDCAKLIQLHGGMTSQHLKTRKGHPVKAFTTKVRAKHMETSSDSELNDVSHHRQQNPDLYYEERWIERRTRRRGNRRRFSRENSRSFSEEELRHTKTSLTNKTTESQRRALSENARYEDDVDATEPNVENGDNLSVERGRRRRKIEIQKKKKKDEKSKSVSESESEEPSKSPKSDEENSSVSEDSLEIVLVTKSLEKKCEKIVSGKKLKTTREVAKNSKSSSKSSKKNLKNLSKKENDKSQIQNSSKKQKSEVAKRKFSNQQQKSIHCKNAETANQRTVDKITVTADIHKNEDTNISEDKVLEVKKEVGIEHQDEEKIKNRIDDILGKADELQTALLAKAADLKKDMEDMRQQMSQKPEEKEKTKEDNVQEEKKDEKIIKDEYEPVDNIKFEEQKASIPTESASKQISNIKKDGTTTENTFAKNKISVDRQHEDLESIESSEVSEKIKKEDESSKKEVEGKEEKQKIHEKDKDNSISENNTKKSVQYSKTDSIDKDELELKKSAIKKIDSTEMKEDVQPTEGISSLKKEDKEIIKTQEVLATQTGSTIPGTEGFRFADETSSSSPTLNKQQSSRRPSRPATGKRRIKIAGKAGVSESSEERSPDRSAIVAVIESPEWDEDDEELDKEIKQVVGDIEEQDEEEDEEESEEVGGDDELGIVRILPSTSEEEIGTKVSAVDSLPRLQAKSNGKSSSKVVRKSNTRQKQHELINGRICRRRDSGGRDSGIEPSPRISRIPKRSIKCYPNSERQQALQMNTVTRDVQISMRRYHLERKIFFQLMELKRLQIRHGKANEQVLVKRQVDAFHKAGMNGPVLGVTRYDHQPFTFRHFESFLYEQLRKLQKRPSTPDWCTEAKQCTQKTHRCHHATSAYTSVPIYTYLGGGNSDRPSLLPKIEGRGKGQMTVEVIHGDEKQVIAVPPEKLDGTKKYYVTFTVRGETTDSDKPKTPSNSATLRNSKSI